MFIDPQADASSPPPAGTTPAAPATLPFRFEGNGFEYFRIWIVNILLSILTLGIYSAWAKVRNHRYFYGNTWLDGHSFEYRARPIAILKGRLIAVGFLFLYSLSGQFMPLLAALLMLLFIAALPWLICQSMAFRHYNSAYRNIRFGFDGRYGQAAMAFLLWPLLALLTLGLLLPMAVWQQKRFYVSHSRYGRHRFEARFEAGAFYRIYLTALGLVILAILAMLVPMVGFLFTLGLYLFAFAYVSARTQNTVFNHSRLLEHGFSSSLHPGRLAWIYFSNGLLVLFTLGLGIPWARVRLARYRAQCLQCNASGPLDQFIAAEERLVNSLAEEVGEAFDLDIGL